MDVNGIPFSRFLDLPFELQCQIISRITEYKRYLASSISQSIY